MKSGTFTERLRELAGVAASAKTFTIPRQGCSVLVRTGFGLRLSVAFPVGDPTAPRDPLSPSEERPVLHAKRPLQIGLHRETDADRENKANGVNREVQTGDPEFDEAIYITGHTPDQTTRQVLADPAVRSACAALVASGECYVTLDDDKANIRLWYYSETKTPAPVAAEDVLLSLETLARKLPAVIETGRQSRRWSWRRTVGLMTAIGTPGAIGVGYLIVARWASAGGDELSVALPTIAGGAMGVAVGLVLAGAIKPLFVGQFHSATKRRLAGIVAMGVSIEGCIIAAHLLGFQDESAMFTSLAILLVAFAAGWLIYLVIESLATRQLWANWSRAKLSELGMRFEGDPLSCYSLVGPAWGVDMKLENKVERKPPGAREDDRPTTSCAVQLPLTLPDMIVCRTEDVDRVMGPLPSVSRTATGDAEFDARYLVFISSAGSSASDLGGGYRELAVPTALAWARAPILASAVELRLLWMRVREGQGEVVFKTADPEDAIRIAATCASISRASSRGALVRIPATDSTTKLDPEEPLRIAGMGVFMGIALGVVAAAALNYRTLETILCVAGGVSLLRLAAASEALKRLQQGPGGSGKKTVDRVVQRGDS